MSDTAAPKKGQIFTTRAVALMLGIGVAAFVALTALTAYAPELRDGGDGGAHALSRSAVGFAGIAQLIKTAGGDVLVSRGELHRPSGAPGLLILTPPVRELDDKALARLRASGRPVLVVLPKWTTAPVPERRGWVARMGLVSPAGAALAVAELTGPQADTTAPAVTRRRGSGAPTLTGLAGRFKAGGPYTIGSIDRLQTLSPPGAAPLIEDEAHRAVLLALDRRTFVLTDPDLLNNRGLRSLHTARAGAEIIRVLRDGGGPVVFDVTLNGFSRSRSLLRTALGAPFLGATLIALAAALLMGAHAAVRFGPALRPGRALALGKRVLVENSAVLIRLAGRRARMGERYAGLIRRIAAKAALPAYEAAPDKIDAALDRLSRKDEPLFSALAAEANLAATDGELMAAARRLHRWKLEITRERC